MKKKMKSRNPIAIACRVVNSPKVFRSKKGKGSYKRFKTSLDN
jgi:stalled ribosome alternative rescue factor ArfA